MSLSRMRRILAPMLVAVLLLVSGCGSQTAEPTRWDSAQQESTQQQRGQAVAKDAEQGSRFNRFFPEAGEGYDLVYTQEKKGFAAAKLKQNGKEVAALAVSDISSNPSAADKYQNSAKTIAGYPAAELGKTQTSVLVGDRFQVKISSRDDSFTPSDREAWLQRFDLQGIEGLAKN